MGKMTKGQVGRPAIGSQRKISISVALDMDIWMWLTKKDNKSAVANLALKQLMEHEKANEIPFLNAEIEKQKAMRKEIENNIIKLIERKEKLEEREKLIVEEEEKKTDDELDKITEAS